MFNALFAGLQYLLPKHLLTRLIYRLARVRYSAIKDTLIRSFVKVYDVNVEEIAQQVPEDFATFNEFFIRELQPGARPIDPAANSIVSPVDGTVSMAANIDGQHLIQAKGIEYSLDDLFAIDLEEARAFSNGIFATIYLAPYNYHRVHMPIDGELVSAHYVPGDLFSVNEATVASLPGLFRRNERLNLHFATAFGPATLVFVGALNVGSITTPWTGEIRPRKKGVVESMKLTDAPIPLSKGDLLGWFNMGSTVIFLLPERAGTWSERLEPGAKVRMGEAIGTLQEENP